VKRCLLTKGSAARLAFYALLTLWLPGTFAELCDASKKFCGYWPGSSDRSTGAPTRGGKIKVNPSAVPVDKGTGIEAIFFDGVDFSIVKGFGRVGAGISMSNSEDTFFGAPSIELPHDYLARQNKNRKYDSKKYTLATAFKVYRNKKSGMKQFDTNLGVMGKYNTLTKSVLGGAGVSGKAGFFTYGYSLYRDETQLDYSDYFGYEGVKPTTGFFVETASIGVFLHSLAIDYSLLRMVTNDTWTTKTLTTSLMLKRTILTFATRNETSTRPYYNEARKSLSERESKSDIFLGAQFNIGKHWLAGVFYNYYNLDEFSLGATFFL